MWPIKRENVDAHVQIATKIQRKYLNDPDGECKPNNELNDSSRE